MSEMCAVQCTTTSLSPLLIINKTPQKWFNKLGGGECVLRCCIYHRASIQSNYINLVSGPAWKLRQDSGRPFWANFRVNKTAKKLYSYYESRQGDEINLPQVSKIKFVVIIILAVWTAIILSLSCILNNIMQLELFYTGPLTRPLSNHVELFELYSCEIEDNFLKFNIFYFINSF